MADGEGALHSRQVTKVPCDTRAALLEKAKQEQSEVRGVDENGSLTMH